MVKQKKRFARSPQLLIDPQHIKTQLRIGDLCDLITWCFCSSTPPVAPKWIGVENKNGIEHIVSVMVPGLPISEIIDIENPKPQHMNSERVPALAAFEYGWSTRANAHRDRIDFPENSISQVPFTKAQKKQQSKHRKEIEDKLRDSPLPLTDLLAPQATLRRLGFVFEAPTPQWKPTRAVSHPQEPPQEWQALALDCEMCLAASGQVLTRVSVVNSDLECIYSTYVKPKEPIIDYLTQYSGITPDLLEGVTTTFEEVQDWFVENVTPGTILVGHSVDNDLAVLKIVHHDCIDTGLLYPHPKGLPFRHALKWLAQKYLNKTIQDGHDGHDPTIDASTCMELVNLKRHKGLEFGNVPLAKSLVQVLKDEGKSTAIIDYGVPYWDTTQAAQSVISVTSDREVVETVRKQCPKHSYTFAALRQLSKATPETFDEALSATSACIQDIVDSMPPRSVLMVWTGYGDRTAMWPLVDRRTKFRHEYRTKPLSEIDVHWTAADDEALIQAAQIGRMGLSMVKMIPGELPRESRESVEPLESVEPEPVEPEPVESEPVDDHNDGPPRKVARVSRDTADVTAAESTAESTVVSTDAPADAPADAHIDSIN